MIELGITDSQLATMEHLIASVRVLVSMMPTNDNDDFLDVYEETLNACCHAEQAVRKVRRQGS
jgi:hypothetical protein